MTAASRDSGDSGFVAQLEGLHATLRALDATVAVAESLTGGLVAAALTDTPGASLTMRGGLVVYATDLKSSLAGVPADLLNRRGAVDPEVALALAHGVRDRLQATFGVGVTGVAGPDPQDGQPVGTVYIAIASSTADTVAERVFAGDRASIRRQATRTAVDLLAEECAVEIDRQSAH